MDTITLLKPTEKYSSQILAFRKEILANQIDVFDGCTFLEECETVKDWLNLVKRFETDPDEGFVQSSTFIAVRPDDDKLIGIIDLRHNLDNPMLSTWGGHIGYTIRPSERKKGYGKEILRLNLVNAKNLGLKQILITCNSENIASEKIIIANGGVFDKQISVENKNINRYWIHI